MKKLQEQNQNQKDRIVEMEARLKNMNSPLKEQNNQKHLKIDENAKTIDCFTCDKCGFNTNSLATLVKHKTNVQAGAELGQAQLPIKPNLIYHHHWKLLC